MVLMLMVSIGHSQNTSKEDRVKIYVDVNGDTITTMSYRDSKILLEDVLKYKYSDSLVTQYKKNEFIYNGIIIDQNNKIGLLEEKYNNLFNINTNQNLMLLNKDKQLEIALKAIEEREKEIKRQKTKKIIGFIGAGAVVVGTLLIAI